MNDASAEPEIAQRPRAGAYPLSALFILIGMFAILLAMVAPIGASIDQGKVGYAEVLFATLGGASLLMIVGCMIGLYHDPKIGAAVVGALVGSMVGMAVGPAVIVMQHQLDTVLANAAGGSLLLICAAIAIRLISRPLAKSDPPEQQ